MTIDRTELLALLPPPERESFVRPFALARILETTEPAVVRALRELRIDGLAEPFEAGWRKTASGGAQPAADGSASATASRDASGVRTSSACETATPEAPTLPHPVAAGARPAAAAPAGDTPSGERAPLSERLDAVRVARGLSWGALADEIGVSRAELSRAKCKAGERPSLGGPAPRTLAICGSWLASASAPDSPGLPSPARAPQHDATGEPQQGSGSAAGEPPTASSSAPPGPASVVGSSPSPAPSGPGSSGDGTPAAAGDTGAERRNCWTCRWAPTPGAFCRWRHRSESDGVRDWMNVAPGAAHEVHPEADDCPGYLPADERERISRAHGDDFRDELYGLRADLRAAAKVLDEHGVPAGPLATRIDAALTLGAEVAKRAAPLMETISDIRAILEDGLGDERGLGGDVVTLARRARAALQGPPAGRGARAIRELDDLRDQLIAVLDAGTDIEDDAELVDAVREVRGDRDHWHRRHNEAVEECQRWASRARSAEERARRAPRLRDVVRVRVAGWLGWTP